MYTTLSDRIDKRLNGIQFKSKICGEMAYPFLCVTRLSQDCSLQKELTKINRTKK